MLGECQAASMQKAFPETDSHSHDTLGVSIRALISVVPVRESLSFNPLPSKTFLHSMFYIAGVPSWTYPGNEYL